MKKIEEIISVISTVLLCAGVIATLVAAILGFDRIIDFANDEGVSLGRMDGFFMMLYVIVVPMSLNEMLSLFVKGRLLLKILLFVALPAAMVMLCGWFDGLFWWFAVMIAELEYSKRTRGEKPKFWFKVRHLFFKRFEWEDMTRAEIVSYALRNEPYMRKEERDSIENRIKKYNLEEDERGLKSFLSKTGLVEVPSVLNPDRLLSHASDSAIRRGWTSVEEIKDEFGIDRERAERIMEQMCMLHICGPSKEVHLASLGEAEIRYLLNIGRMGEPV